jgi:hypothetical protein
MIVLPGRFGKSRTAQAPCVLGLSLEAAAAEKAKQGKHKDDDQDDPEDAHVYSFAFVASKTNAPETWLRTGACVRPYG